MASYAFASRRFSHRRLSEGAIGERPRTQGSGVHMAKAPKRDIKEVWIDFKKNKSEALRNVLLSGNPFEIAVARGELADIVAARGRVDPGAP